MKLAFIAISLQIFWRKCFRHVCWVVLYQTYTFCTNLSIWLVVMATKKLNLQKNIQKPTPGGWSWNFAEMFIAFGSTKLVVAYALWLLWQLIVSIDLLWGKMKLGFNCCLIADILTELFQNRLMSSPSPSIKQLCKLLILICAIATERLKYFYRCSLRWAIVAHVPGFRIPSISHKHNLCISTQSNLIVLENFYIICL